MVLESHSTRKLGNDAAALTFRWESDGKNSISLNHVEPAQEKCPTISVHNAEPIPLSHAEPISMSQEFRQNDDMEEEIFMGRVRLKDFSGIHDRLTDSIAKTSNVDSRPQPPPPTKTATSCRAAPHLGAGCMHAPALGVAFFFVPAV